MVAESKLPNELDRYIAATSAADRMAELSTHVDVERWTSYLETMPIPVKILTDRNVISRTDLFDLASVDRRLQSDQSILELFWNVIAWGIAGSWRNVPRLTKQVGGNCDAVATTLRTVQRLSYEGSVEDAFAAARGQIKHLGPAFFTKFLYFTSNETDPTHALILDDRVRVAWRILADRWLDSGSATDYSAYCTEACEAAGRLQLKPAEVEACLYHLGRRAQTYEAWLLANLRLCQKRLGQRAPSVPETLTELEISARPGRGDVQGNAEPRD